MSLTDERESHEPILSFQMRCKKKWRWMSLTDERESYEPMSFMPDALQERIEPNVFNWRAWKLRAHSFIPNALQERIEPNVFNGWMPSVLKDNSLPSGCGQRARLEKNQISGTISIDRRQIVVARMSKIQTSFLTTRNSPIGWSPYSLFTRLCGNATNDIIAMAWTIDTAIDCKEPRLVSVYLVATTCNP